MLFADSMECPLSKEELLELVEEEARLRVSTSFLEEVAISISQLYFPAASLTSLSGGAGGERGQNRWNRCYPENARGVGEEARPPSGDG